MSAYLRVFIQMGKPNKFCIFLSDDGGNTNIGCLMKTVLVQPPLIRYNLKDRGRQFRGVERNFDIPAIVAAINSPACQERVKTRGMLGYLGHWVRIRFGLEPPEGGIAQGKAQAVEPAIVTTYLKAYPNGDIEHQTEFLDTDPGRIASRMYDSKVGGFSSAIDEK